MPASDSPAVLVARFLKANHYNETLDAFIKEAGLSPDAGSTGPGDWTIEKVLEEKKQYDVSLRYEKTGDDENQGWTLPAPSSPHEPKDLDGTSNILSVNAQPSSETIIVTAADRRMHLLSSNSPFSSRNAIPNLHGSPVLSVCQVADGIFLSSSMSGQIILHDLSGAVFATRRDHSKYTVQVKAFRDESHVFIATAGWDQKVLIYSTELTQAAVGPNSSANALQDPVHTIYLPSNPESLIFARHPATDLLHLIVSRRDSTHLYYYLIESSKDSKPVVSEAGRQNLAPHSNAWVAFTPSCLSICPNDPTLLAAATSHLPHMKLIVARLLFPGVSSIMGNASAPQTQAALARTMLAIQDREDAAIRLHVSTLAPQTPYSTPQVVWRPDGSGVWVNGDDGVIRGIEVQSGRVVAVLKGHEAGTKVRTLWAGRVGIERDGGLSEDNVASVAGREVLVSGGFDKRVLVWDVNDADGMISE